MIDAASVRTDPTAMLPTGSPRPTSYAPSRKFPPTPSQGIRGNSLSNNRKALFCGSLALGRRFGGFALGGSPFGLSGGSGFGIGLNYVLQVINAHGGKISVKSEKDKWSEFTISLPK